MSHPPGIAAVGTAATAGRGHDPAVCQTVISSGLRQRRQLRQGYLISYEKSLVSRAHRQSYIRQLLKTLPTLPALPFGSGINAIRTAGRGQQPSPAAVNRALSDASLTAATLPLGSSGSIRLQDLLMVEALASTCG
jgi:hypothetical protein